MISFIIKDSILLKESYIELSKTGINSDLKIKPIPLEGNTKQHIILFDPDGNISRKQSLCDCKKCIAGDVEECLFSKANGKIDLEVNKDGDFDEDDDNYDADDDEEDYDSNEHMIFDVVLPGQVIALRTPFRRKGQFLLSCCE